MGFDGVPEAHQLLHENKHLGKISILVGAESEAFPPGAATPADLAVVSYEPGVVDTAMQADITAKASDQFSVRCLRRFTPGAISERAGDFFPSANS